MNENKQLGTCQGFNSPHEFDPMTCHDWRPVESPTETGAQPVITLSHGGCAGTMPVYGLEATEREELDDRLIKWLGQMQFLDISVSAEVRAEAAQFRTELAARKGEGRG